MEICFRTVFYDSIIMEFLCPSSVFSQLTFVDMIYFWNYNTTIERACEGYFFNDETELENILRMFLETIDNYENRIIEKFVSRIRPRYANGDENPINGAAIDNNGDIKDDKKDKRTSD